MPSTVNVCQDFSVSATVTGSTNFTYMISWSISSNASNTTADNQLSSYFNSPSNQTTILVKSNLLRCYTSYNISIIATNQYNYQFSQSAVITGESGNFTSDCSACVSGLYLFQDECIESCQLGYYYNTSDQACIGNNNLFNEICFLPTFSFHSL